MNNNLYFYYQANLQYLLKNKYVDYTWNKISNLEFYDYKGLEYENFLTKNPDPWLHMYSHNKLLLATDILNNGMYTPFFYYTKNNKNYIFLGRHRFYSLKLYEFIYNKKIDKNFLFIKLPTPFDNNQLSLNHNFYMFNKLDFNIKKTKLQTYKDINKLLILTGEGLSTFLFNT